MAAGMAQARRGTQGRGAPRLGRAAAWAGPALWLGGAERRLGGSLRGGASRTRSRRRVVGLRRARLGPPRPRRRTQLRQPLGRGWTWWGALARAGAQRR